MNQRRDGYPPQHPGMYVQQPGDFTQAVQRMENNASHAAAEARRAMQAVGQVQAAAGKMHQIESQHELIIQDMRNLSNVIAALSENRIGGSNGNPSIQRIEQIPGRRIPYDALTEINIGASETTTRTGTITITNEGPFIAVARFAAFLSGYTFNFINPTTLESAKFLGRSNGRWRPITSAVDIMDGALPADVVRNVAFPGNGAPSYSSPALHAPYRTMEFDGRITQIDQATSMPRSNKPVPSSFYSTFINSPFQLGALDFYDRADIIQYNVEPQHVNNPTSGSLSAYGAGGLFPFSDAQFDHHEGINDTENLNLNPGDADPVTRLPNGTLVIGMHGYRILQPPGATVNTSAV